MEGCKAGRAGEWCAQEAAEALCHCALRTEMKLDLVLVFDISRSP